MIDFLAALKSHLTVNVLYHTIPHELYGCEVKDVYGLQSSISTILEKKVTVCFSPSLCNNKCF